MGIDAHQLAAGYVAEWPDLFTQAELDRIEAYGDSLSPMKAELAGRKDNIDYLRVTRVAWLDRCQEIEWLYARIERARLALRYRRDGGTG